MKKQKQKKKRKNNQHYSKTIRHSWERSDSRIVVQNNDSGQAGMTINNTLLFLFILLLPTQFGKHFFFDFSYLSGIRVDYLAPTVYLTDLLAAVLILFNLKSVLKFFSDKKIIILLSLLLLNVLISQNIVISIYRYLKILELLGVFIIFRQQKLSFTYLLYGFLIGVIFQLFISTSQFISKHSLQGMFYFLGERPLSLSMPGIAKASLNGIEILRPYGTFSHPNSLAGFYLLVYFFVLTRFRLISTSFNKFQLISTSLLFICSLLIFISFSKVAILTFLVLNFIYLWRSPLKKYCKFCFFARTFIILIISLVFLQAQADPLTLQKRIYLMQNALIIIGKRLFFGVGFGNYLLAQQQFPQRFADFLNQPVHNIFLLFLSETGVIITIAVFMLFFAEIKKLFKKFPYIFAVILLTGFFDHYWLTLQQNFLLIGVVVGLL